MRNPANSQLIYQIVPMKKNLLWGILLILLTNGKTSFAQKKWDASAGLGIAELANLGIRYQPSKLIEVGFKAGTWKMNESKLSAFSGDIYFHLGGKPVFTTIPPWYAKLGVNIMRDKRPDFLSKISYVNMRVGRDFYLSPRWGFKLDGGLNIEVYSNEEQQTTNNGEWNWNINIDFPVLPAAGIDFFYRIF